MEQIELKAIVENILLAADEPVTVEDLKKTLLNGTEKSDIQSALQELTEDYQARNLQIQEVAGGYQLCTRQEYTEWVRKYLKLDKTAKLSQPSLDTLSIIAYKQPLTRQEMEDIRGVDSSGVIKTLLEKKIIAPAGRKKVPGRPIMYSTTRQFLEYFGLNDLSDLPTLEDFTEEGLVGSEGLQASEGGAATENDDSPDATEDALDSSTENEETLSATEETQSPVSPPDEEATEEKPDQG